MTADDTIHKRSVAQLIPRLEHGQIDIRFMLQQHLDDGGMLVVDCFHQCSHTVLVSSVYIGPLGQ